MDYYDKFSLNFLLFCALSEYEKCRHGGSFELLFTQMFHIRTYCTFYCSKHALNDTQLRLSMRRKYLINTLRMREGTLMCAELSRTVTYVTRNVIMQQS
jgi:hypothetical protein